MIFIISDDCSCWAKAGIILIPYNRLAEASRNRFLKNKQDIIKSVLTRSNDEIIWSEGFVMTGRLGKGFHQFYKYFVPMERLRINPH